MDVMQRMKSSIPCKMLHGLEICINIQQDQPFLTVSKSQSLSRFFAYLDISAASHSRLKD